MHFLSLMPLVWFVPLSHTYSISSSLFDFTRSEKSSCRGPLNIPVLESEMLDPVTLRRLTKPLVRLVGMYGDSDDSGGTSGFIPKQIPFEKEARTRPWKSDDVEDSALMDPNQTGLYFRDQVLNVQSYPWSTVGRVDFKRFRGDSGGWCTASLVGRNLMLTASHCFPWGFGPGRWMRFAPAYNNGHEPYGQSYVSRCRGVMNTRNVTGIDYIICHLCEPLGELAGWMGTHWWRQPLNYTQTMWRSSGYPGDSLGGHAQMIRFDIRLNGIDRHGDKGSELESDVYASPGWSGGPMWGEVDGVPKIVGVCSGSEKNCSEQIGGCSNIDDGDPGHDVSAGGRLMTDLVVYGLTHWTGREL